MGALKHGKLRPVPLPNSPTMKAEEIKYADWVRLLSEDNDHLRASPARGYWRLAPHYVGQVNDCACSLASATMIVNAVRGARSRDAGSKMVTQQSLLAAVDDEIWHRGSGRDGGPGVTLSQLARLLSRGLDLHDAAARVEIVPLHNVADPATAAARFRRALDECEGGRRLIVANYYSEIVIGSGDFGHFSPIAAFDAVRDRALILDVWRFEYEPYWVPVDKLLTGMTTVSSVDGESRGYLDIVA